MCDPQLAPGSEGARTFDADSGLTPAPKRSAPRWSLAQRRAPLAPQAKLPWAQSVRPGFTDCPCRQSRADNECRRRSLRGWPDAYAALRSQAGARPHIKGLLATRERASAELTSNSPTDVKPGNAI